MAKCYFFTGLPCSGKTTLAKELLKHIDAEWFDGDDVRKTPLTNESFSVQGRNKHLLRLGYIGKLLIDRNINVIISCIAPYKKTRDKIRKMYDLNEFIEIYISTPLDVCKGRDVKGMYKMAEAGEIHNFTGVNSRYEEPKNAEININTYQTTAIQCIEKILGAEEKKHTIIFNGRFQPFHLAHKAIIDKELNNGNKVVVCIKFDRTDDKNPYTPNRIKQMIKSIYGDKVDIYMVPNFNEIVYGRTVGYEMRQVHLEKTLEDISATRIRGLKECEMNIYEAMIPKEIKNLI